MAHVHWIPDLYVCTALSWALVSICFAVGWKDCKRPFDIVRHSAKQNWKRDSFPLLATELAIRRRASFCRLAYLSVSDRRPLARISQGWLQSCQGWSGLFAQGPPKTSSHKSQKVHGPCSGTESFKAFVSSDKASQTLYSAWSRRTLNASLRRMMGWNVELFINLHKI